MIHALLHIILWGSLAALGCSLLFFWALWRTAEHERRRGLVQVTPGLAVERCDQLERPWVIPSGVVVPASGIVPLLPTVELCPHCGRVL